MAQVENGVIKLGSAIRAWKILFIVLVIVAVAMLVTAALYFWIVSKNKDRSEVMGDNDQICKAEWSMKVVGIVGTVGLLFGSAGLAIQTYSPSNAMIANRHVKFLASKPKALSCQEVNEETRANVKVYTKSIMGKQEIQMRFLVCDDGFDKKDIYFSLYDESSPNFILGDVCYTQGAQGKMYYTEIIITQYGGVEYDRLPTFEYKKKLQEDFEKFLTQMETVQKEFTECHEGLLISKNYNRGAIERAKNGNFTCQLESQNDLKPVHYKTATKIKTVYCADANPQVTFQNYLEDLLYNPKTKFSRYTDVNSRYLKYNEPMTFYQYCLFFKDFVTEDDRKVKDITLPD